MAILNEGDFSRMNYEQQKLLVKKRMYYPLFKYYGNVTKNALEILKREFSTTPSTLHTAVSLRLKQLPPEINNVDKNDVRDYNQYDIQHRDPDDENIEKNYKHCRPEFQTVYDEISYMLNSPICRMRYATIKKDDNLLYHIDQPGQDRFIMVVEGEQIVYWKTKDGEFQQLMKPGEVWYLNSNWEHMVENIGTQQRLALLGCFEYNNSKEDNK